MRILKISHLTSPLLVLLVVFAMAEIYHERNLAASHTATNPQDVNSLDRRISMLEQRFYLLDSRISRLEQQIGMIQRAPSPSSNTRELETLQNQMQLFERRLAEIDCAIVKLDERTLTTAARDSRKSNVPDPCRLNPGTPIRLSTRP